MFGARSKGKVGLLELYGARVWNILNEGKSFFVVFSAFILILNFIMESHSFHEFITVILVTSPLWFVFFRYDFPLKYRSFLWLLLAVNLLIFRYVNLTFIFLIFLFYFFFTVILWGSIYYHLRIGIPLTNFTRFWKLVLEDSDSTSGNSMEQIPKIIIVVTTVLALLEYGIGPMIPSLFLFMVFALFFGMLSNRLFFQEVPNKETGEKTIVKNTSKKLSNNVIVIVIDGCRRDRLNEAHTPTIDHLIKTGTDCTNMRTVYPSRTSVCFSSMFTGAPKEKHNIKSNLVIKSLLGREGMDCESIFEVLHEKNMRGRIIAIAHLVDVFGENVKPISAVHPNDTVDAFIMEKTREMIEKEDPELLVVQLISTDQTGHALGTSHPEYLKKIEGVDKLLEEFLKWLEKKDKLKDTTLIFMADHGQSVRGIGGHGHWDKGEKYVPFIMWGKSVKKATISKPTRILDIAPTIAYLLGVRPPKECIGETLMDALNEEG